MKPIDRELMTAGEAARWFRRSASWLRRQKAILKLAGPGGRPLYHLAACRAYLLGIASGWDAQMLRAAQLDALKAASGLSAAQPPPAASSASASVSCPS